jgi:hypothetical protein
MWNVRLDIVDCSASLGCVTEFQLVQRDSCTTLCGSPSVAYSSILNTCTADHVIAQPPTLHRSCATMWQTARALPLDSMTCPPANISAEFGATRKTIPKALDSQTTSSRDAKSRRPRQQPQPGKGKRTKEHHPRPQGLSSQPPELTRQTFASSALPTDLIINTLPRVNNNRRREPYINILDTPTSLD